MSTTFEGAMRPLFSNEVHMASDVNSYKYQNYYTFEKDVISIFGSFKIEAAGAVTSDSVQGLGVADVVKSAGDGDYLITFDGAYDGFLGIQFTVVTDNDAIPVAVSVHEAAATAQADIKAAKGINVTLTSATATAANADNPTMIMFEAKFRMGEFTSSSKISYGVFMLGIMGNKGRDLPTVLMEEDGAMYESYEEDVAIPGLGEAMEDLMEALEKKDKCAAKAHLKDFVSLCFYHYKGMEPQRHISMEF